MEDQATYGQQTGNGCTLTDKELVEKCRQWIDRLDGSGGQEWLQVGPRDPDWHPENLFRELSDRLENRNHMLAEFFTAGWDSAKCGMPERLRQTAFGAVLEAKRIDRQVAYIEE